MNLNGIQNADIRKLVREAVDRGWTVTRNGSSHLVLRHPSGGRTWTTATRCRGRAAANLAAQIRRIERGAAA